MLMILPLLLQAAGQPAQLEPPPKAAPVTGEIHQVTLGPLFRQPYMCIEHPLGQLAYAGDALGTDCLVIGGIDGASGFTKTYRTDGKTNEDWYGWHAEVLAPVDGTVLGVLDKPETNTPGTMGPPPAGTIRFLTDDGVVIVYGHATRFRVKAGDRVTAGQVVAIDGNNGVARAPHIHVGAYRQDTLEPLQIRWDLRAAAEVQQAASQ